MQFDAYRAALTQAHFPTVLSSGDVKEVWGQDDSLEEFADEVFNELKSSKTLAKVFLQGEGSPTLSLVSGTSYDVSSKLDKEAVKYLCMLALDEASPTVLDARKRLLATDEVMSLRQNLWFAINRELTANHQTATGAPCPFSYWDGIPDSIQTSGIGNGLYPEEVVVKVSKCFEEDEQDLKALGNYLTTCRALANNRDASPSDRVIEEKTKKLIDELLAVSIL